MPDRDNDLLNDPLEDDADIESVPSPEEIRAEKKAQKEAEKEAKRLAKKQGGRSKGGIIAIVIFVLLLGAGAAVIALDIGGVREQHIMPHVRNIPLVGGMFPAPEEYAVGVDLRTPDQLRNVVNAQDIQIQSLENQNAALEAQLAAANQRINTLLGFEENHQEVQMVAAEIQRIIAHGDPVGFYNYFRFVMDGEHADQLFREAVQINEFNEGILSQVRALNLMEAEGAGRTMERYMLTNPSLLQRWLRIMSAARLAEVFDTFDATEAGTSTVASMINLMTPTEPVILPLVPPVVAIPPITPPVAPPPEMVYDDEDETNDEEPEEETPTDDEENDIENDIEDDEAEEEPEEEPTDE